MRQLALLVPVLFALGCGGDDAASTPPDAAPSADTAVTDSAGGETTIRFAASVGTEPFSCAKTFDVGAPKTTIEPLDFRLYVHDVRLVRADKSEVALDLVQDGKWQYQNLALLDFEDKSGTCANGTVDVNTKIVAKAVQGPFVGIKLRVGVPFALNHGDTATAASPLNLSGLFWTWNSGYKFARIDVRPKTMIGADAGADGGDAGSSHGAGAFNLHLGSTGCVGEATDSGVKSCAKPNVGEVFLDGFDPTAKTVVLDLASLLETTNVGSDGGGAPGCMSGPTDPECITVMPRFGIDLATGAPDAAAQKFFRSE